MIEVLSIDGKVLQQSTMKAGSDSHTLDMSDYPAAVYLVSLRN